jgi:hypothetical protein
MASVSAWWAYTIWTPWWKGRGCSRYQPRAIIYSGGWTTGDTIDHSLQANQTNINKIPATGIGSVSVFNDAIRDGLNGSVFEKTGTGYINGISQILPNDFALLHHFLCW